MGVRPSQEELDSAVRANKLMTYMAPAYGYFTRNGEFEGATVLEIGGSALPRSFIFDFLKVRRWMSVDILGGTGIYQQLENSSHYKSVPLLKLSRNSDIRDPFSRGDYVILDGDAADLPASVDGTFDLIVSVNALEHVLRFPALVERVFGALKPGGRFLSRMGPIWSAPKGSHFWLDSSLNFSTGTLLDFWDHLLLRPLEMHRKLISRGLDIASAEKVINQIYHSPNVNRLHFDEYEPMLQTQPFSRILVRPSFLTDVPDDKLQQLRQRYPWNKNFSAYTMEVLAEK